VGDIADGVSELLAARPEYERAERYYTGKVSELYDSPLIRRALARQGDRYRLNFAAVPVDVVADRLEVAAVTVPSAEDDTSASNRLDGMLQEIWEDNDLLNEIPGWLLAACEYGDAYIVVWEGLEENTVRLDYNSPCVMRIIYDPEDERVPLYAVKMWADSRRRVRRLNLFYSDRTERYSQPLEMGNPGDEGSWKPYESEPGANDAVIPNEYGFPVFHLRNGKPYGTPQHVRAYEPQDGINKIAVGMISNIDYTTTPQRWALAEPQTDSDDDGGDDFLADDNTSTQASGNPGSGLKAGAGELWWLTGAKSVGQFDPADADGYLKPLEFLIRAMAQLTRTPMHYFDPMGDVPSGESLRAADMPLNNRAARLMQVFGGQIGGALEFGLRILGAPDDVHVDVRWKSAQSIDDVDGWNVILLKLKAGVPARQALLEAGYDVEQVDEWLSGSGDSNMVQRVALLAEIATAIRDMSAGVTAGVIDGAVVQSTIDKVLGNLNDDSAK
jgi:hypothetical protein